ncbi:MAG: hypothetical protein FD168_2555 [Desulfobulbaceae bacterium]|nr:MAG: hypothetical protein FD168_2555 [Desulfobulbaceae bacterium]
MTDRKTKLWKRITRVLVLLLACQLVFGCAESNFDLAKESRLPKWFNLPPNLTRSDVTVTMDYYILPWGRKAVFKLWDKKGNTISQVTGKQKGRYPILIQKSKKTGMYDGDPSYEIITADGITDIVEHRKMEPIFYVCDDPDVWVELGVKRD